ncbi:hypothetical protein [Dyadobacter frigoris]|uniref:hypothetical protein n=1 Tax=Dyadobacter frigoris TaxID=2576211 RepID=UPI002553E1F8|nr:hypothetical protein [Dyadobacter frigoris]
MIRKQNGFGRNNFTHREIRLNVLYAFYETWWFRLVAILTICVSLFLIVKYRINSLQKQNRLQEVEIAQRTQTLQITLEVSQDKLMGQMLMLERLLGTISHDIKTPLLFLARSNKRLVKINVRRLACCVCFERLLSKG